MKKCYIAGKITGLPEKEYMAKFADAEDEVKQLLGIEDIVNPVTLPHNHGRTWSDYMRECLKEMLDCDVVFALDNWEDSEGARTELSLAQKLGMKIFYQ